jgi:aconitate hydratase
VLEEGVSWQTLGLKGDETITIRGVADLKPRQIVSIDIRFADGRQESARGLVRIDTLDELEYFRNGGILQYVLRGLVQQAA